VAPQSEPDDVKEWRAIGSVAIAARELNAIEAVQNAIIALEKKTNINKE
jgi:hypothetical protein